MRRKLYTKVQLVNISKCIRYHEQHFLERCGIRQNASKLFVWKKHTEANRIYAVGCEVEFLLSSNEPDVQHLLI